MRALLGAALAAAALATGCAAPAPSSNPAQPDPGLPAGLVAATTGDGAYRHLEELQRIADAHGGNRAVGSPGFDASADYVAGALRAAGFDVSVPEVVVRTYTAGNERLAVGGTPVVARALGLSPAAPDGVSGPLVVLDQDATSGCEPADHTDRSRAAVVLVRRGTCPFGQKVQVAADAGAVAVVVANSEDGPLTRATLAAPGAVPALGVSRADGDLLATRAGAPTTVALTARTEEVRTHNVVAQTRTGNPGSVVVAGAHLDSVPEGPGINDNGSGSAALLEIAVRLGGSPPVANAVRLAWWGAEETGLNGSTAYVTGLPEPERRALALYLNADMIASPNAGYFVHDGDDSDRVGAGPGPADLRRSSRSWSGPWRPWALRRRAPTSMGARTTRPSSPPVSRWAASSPEPRSASRPNRPARGAARPMLRSTPATTRPATGSTGSTGSRSTATPTPSPTPSRPTPCRPQA